MVREIRLLNWHQEVYLNVGLFTSGLLKEGRFYKISILRIIEKKIAIELVVASLQVPTYNQLYL